MCEPACREARSGRDNMAAERASGERDERRVKTKAMCEETGQKRVTRRRTEEDRRTEKKQTKVQRPTERGRVRTGAVDACERVSERESM